MGCVCENEDRSSAAIGYVGIPQGVTQGGKHHRDLVLSNEIFRLAVSVPLAWPGELAIVSVRPN